MSWEAFLPSNVKANIQNFAGPNVAGLAVQCLETGILVNQSMWYWTRSSRRDPVTVKSTVAFVTAVAAMQTAIAIYNSWRVVVLHFGDLVVLADIGWPDRIQPALNCAMSAPFQAFLIWRCWNVMSRRWIILAPLAALLIATVAINIYITNVIFTEFNVEKNLEIFLEKPPRIFSTAFIISAILDISITILMMYFLFHVKTKVISPRFAKTLKRINRIVWEAAVPPAVCAIFAAVFYSQLATKNLWDVFFQSILGKLYVISFFVVLNGRMDICREAMLPSVNGMRTSHYLSRQLPDFRLDQLSLSSISNVSEEDSDNTPSHSETASAHLHPLKLLTPNSHSASTLPSPASLTPDFSFSQSHAFSLPHAHPLTLIHVNAKPETKTETDSQTQVDTPPRRSNSSRSLVLGHGLEFGFGDADESRMDSYSVASMIVRRPPPAVSGSRGSSDVEVDGRVRRVSTNL